VTKICVVGPSKKYFSGVSAYTICLANALSKNNKVSTLLIRNLLPRFLYPGRKNVGRQDYELELAPEIRVFEGMDWNSPFSWIRAYRFLKQEKPDVIIMAWWTSAVAHMELFLALVNSTSIKSRLILEMHEIVDPLEASKLPTRLYSRMVGRLIRNRTSAFIVHAETVKSQAIEAYHLKREKVFAIPMGVEDNNYQIYSKKSARQELGIKEPFVILNFGMIRKYKGVPSLVQAFEKLPFEIALNSRLVIAGENWGDEEGLDRLIKASPYEKQITFRPEFVPDSEVPKYFSAADVVVLPYLRTSGSAVANLAMAYGKPLIVSDLEFTRQSLQEYEGTIFVPCGDVISIADRMAALYVQHKEGKVTFYATPDDCGWDKVIDRFQTVITQIFESK
jgi:glycosyltransferase involved in cell wall biosynthesis